MVIVLVSSVRRGSKKEEEQRERVRSSDWESVVMSTNGRMSTARPGGCTVVEVVILLVPAVVVVGD